MDRDELLEFLNCNTWDYPRQQRLIELWNEHRGKTSGLITINSIRTPCRMRQIVGSFRRFVKTEMVS